MSASRQGETGKFPQSMKAPNLPAGTADITFQNNDTLYLQVFLTRHPAILTTHIVGLYM